MGLHLLSASATVGTSAIELTQMTPLSGSAPQAAISPSRREAPFDFGSQAVSPAATPQRGADPAGSSYAPPR